MSSTYPGALDSLPDVNPGDTVTAVIENGQTDAINAVESTLGTNPAGSYATVAAALAGKLDLAGGTMTGALSMGTHGITNVTDPGSAQDAATKNYVDTRSLSTFSAPSADISMGSHKLTNVANPLSAQDAATKNYVDLAMPTGTIVQYAGVTVPSSGWLACNGQAVSRTGSNANLFAALVANKSTSTITIASPGVVTNSGHGLSTGNAVFFETTGALPTGISADTAYYAIVIDANTFKIASTYANAIAGTAINTSGSQSGVHTLYFAPYANNSVGFSSSTFNVPDLRGRVPIGTSTSAGSAASASPWPLGAQPLSGSGGEEKHTMSVAELASHYHGPATGKGNYITGTYPGAGPIASGGGAATWDATGITGSTGSSTAFNIVQPASALNFIIKL